MLESLLKYCQKVFRYEQNPELLHESINDPAPGPVRNPVQTLEDEFKSDMEGSAQDLKEFSSKLLSVIARILEISQGVFFNAEKCKGAHVIRYLSGYASQNLDTGNLEYEFGQGLSGQVAKDGKLININSVPEGYITILSGLGEASPRSMIIFPVLNKNQVLAVIELASFKVFSKSDEEFLMGIAPYVAREILKLKKKRQSA